MSNPAPNGWHTVTPRIFVEDVAQMVQFLKHAFEATGDYQATRPCEIHLGDSIIMVSGTEFRGAIPGCFYVYVADTDTVYQRALAAGAESLEAPAVMPYGDRRAMVKDPWNNLWQIATRI